MINDYAVLILSCDKYSDLWNPFFHEFWKYWPDCPYKVYLGSNEISPSPDTKAISLLSGKDVDWSSSFKKILDQIAEEHILVWIEDAFISSQVNTHYIKNTFEFLSKPNVKQIHMKPVPQPDTVTDETFGAYDRRAPYRVTAVGFWRKSTLQKLLLPGENAWNFEIMGSYRTAYEDGYYCLLEQPFEYVHMVEKGKWIAEGLAHCKKVGISIDQKKHPLAGLRFTTQLKQFYFDKMSLVPWSIRLKIMSLLRKLWVCY